MPPPLSRVLKLDRIEPQASGTVKATDAEMASIAALLGLISLEGLRLSYRLQRGTEGRVLLSGRLNAHVAQTCVVTLEPVESDLDSPVDIEFWPEEAVEQLAKTEDELGGAGALDWPEPIREGSIDLGPVVYETLATSLDPYPRKEGASFEWSHDEATEAPGPRSGPFAALARLKRP
jgi:uncharacterized metal-binding protein YceD (DUF177 family)